MRMYFDNRKIISLMFLFQWVSVFAMEVNIKDGKNKKVNFSPVVSKCLEDILKTTNKVKFVSPNKKRLYILGEDMLTSPNYDTTNSQEIVIKKSIGHC